MLSISSVDELVQIRLFLKGHELLENQVFKAFRYRFFRSVIKASVAMVYGSSLIMCQKIEIHCYAFV